MNKAESILAHPEFPWLWLDEPQTIEEYLRQQGWIDPAEAVHKISKAGEGNMNLTLRVITSRRQFIVKQARPWVEKYDQIEAPWGRMHFEQQFYERTKNIPAISHRMPRMLGMHAEGCAVMLEDLFPADDLTSLYRGDALLVEEARSLADYLAAVHQAIPSADLSEFSNREMRRLNHEHIFVVPMGQIEGFDWDAMEPGFSQAAEEIHRDGTLRDRLAPVAKEYLTDGPSLLHGDYFPGSWLRTARGIQIIDTEFAHAGRPEHDLGVAFAHLAVARQSREIAEAFLAQYRQSGLAVDESRLAAYGGVEVIRRLIGVAQLPLGPTDGWRATILRRGRSAVIDGTWRALWDGP